mmetsp:Transcript_32881/g.83458  ORF Transcript_32881/g.83458 Transcript_32881/m.83458 type:complete len:373 (+) Transcript_32881:143-1261(+)
MRSQYRSPSGDIGEGLRSPSGQSKQGANIFDSLWIKLLLVAAYLSLNISINLLNKWTISIYGFKFPIFLSMCHQAFSALALAPMMLLRSSYREQHSATITKQWPGLLAISAFFAFNLGANNISLITISLSLNQVIRACIPVATAVGAVLIEAKPPTRKEAVSLVVLVMGVGISIFEGSDTKATAHGILLCVLGTISNGFMMASIGKLLSEKLDVWRLTFYTAPVTCAMLALFYWKLESSRFAAYQMETLNHSMYAALILVGCVNALAYNVVHSLVIKVTSSVTTTVLGEAKIVLLLVLSSIWLGEADIWTPKMLLGVTTAILGFAMYSHAKLATGTAQYLPVIKGMPELAPMAERKEGSGSLGSRHGEWAKP